MRGCFFVCGSFDFRHTQVAFFSGRDNAGAGLKALEERDLLPEGQSCDALLEKLTLETELEKAVKDADYVIEAVPEVMEIKQDVYKKLGSLTPNHTILASDTSTMSISKIGAAECRGKSERSWRWTTWKR